MSGLTPQGFESKSVEEIRDEIAAQLRARIGGNLNLEPDSILGHLVGIVAEQLATVWDVGQGVYRSAYPDSASGNALDNVAAITGAVRLAASRSRVTVLVEGDENTVLPPGRVVSVADTGARFRSIDEVTIGAGPTPMEMESEELGPIFAAAGSLTEIETPVSGWDSVSNPLDAIPGRRMETDPEFRLRRERLLRATGSGTVEALRAGLLEPGVAGVEQVRVFENTGIDTDEAGVPGKSFEAVVEGGDEQEIREAIWRLKPAGILAHGDISGTVNDSLGFPHTIKFSRPSYQDVHVAVTVEVGPGYPLDGATRIKQALFEYARGLRIGEDVVYSRLFGVIYSVGGIVDVPSLLIGVDDADADENITIGPRELARISTADVDVTEV